MVWPLRDRKDQLARLVVGDIFHAKPSSPEGASLICLVVSVTESTIHARTVTHQMQTEFDRQTGEGVWGDDRIPCTIDSTAPLPVEIHNVMLGLDRKNRLERLPERVKPNDAEIQAILFLDAHYASDPL
jgi:hypothetical protein